MKKYIVLTCVHVMFSFGVMSQNLTQTVRGKIYDYDNQLPLPGATVVILETNPLLAASSDLEGDFKLENIPVGRITIQLSYIGYESITMPNIVVNSGKEVVLDLYMRESALALDEIVVKAAKNKGEAENQMALISARSVSFEETNRFAGAFNDASLKAEIIILL